MSIKEVLILTLLFSFGSPDKAKSETDSKLFGKDRSIDKVIIKHQVGYHFKKIVRTVELELFISRKISVAPIVEGVQTLRQVQLQLDEYCNNLSGQKWESSERTVNVISNPPIFEPQKPFSNQLYHVSYVKSASFAEAKARCQALGMRLPEVYTKEEAEELSKFLKANSLESSFAGIEYDVQEGIQRFITTGLPIWHGYYKRVNLMSDVVKTIDIKPTLDDAHGRFMYSKGNFMEVFTPKHGPVHEKYTFNTEYWNWKTDYHQLVSPVVCAPPWKGDNLVISPTTKVKDITVVNYSREKKIKRSISKVAVKSTPLANLQATCKNIVNRIGDVHINTNDKMTDVLQLVDISVVQQNTLNSGRKKRENVRNKRMIGFALKAGASLLWNVFGLYQNVKTEKRIKKLETAMTLTREQVAQNSALMSDMTKVIYDHSVVMDDLQLTTRNLVKGLTEVKSEVNGLKTEISLVKRDVEVMTTLMRVDSMVSRIEASLDNSYYNLKDIIHSSLKSETSPLVLPHDQVQKVQAEVNSISPSVMDTDFKRMQSIVVSHPKDPSSLLVIVNAAAMSRDSLELVELVPVPYFVNQVAHLPILDHQFVVLNQKTATFTVLSQQEMDNCLENRCYIRNMGQPISSAACGAPQYFDQSLDACEFEARTSDGIAVINIDPDGFIFSFETEVKVQLFGHDNQATGPPKQMKGIGVLQIPTGYSIVVTRADGYRVEVNGQPRYYSLDAADLDVSSNSILSTPIKEDNIFKVPKNRESEDSELEQQVITVKQAVDETQHRIASQHNHVWILTGCIVSITVITVIIMIVLYYNSRRFRKKVLAVRHTITELSQQVTDFAKPLVPPRSPLIGSLRKARTLPITRSRRRRLPSVKFSAPIAEYLALSEVKSPRLRGKKRIYDQVPVRSASKLAKTPRVYPTVPTEDDLKDGYETSIASGSNTDVRCRSIDDAVSVTSIERSDVNSDTNGETNFNQRT